MIQYQPLTTDYFFRQSKRLCKKYPHLKADIIACVRNFDERFATHLGNNIYKLRLKSSDIPRGKSKSFRLIVLIFELEKLLTPLTLYYKGDRSNVTDEEIESHVQSVLSELRSSTS